MCHLYNIDFFRCASNCCKFLWLLVSATFDDDVAGEGFGAHPAPSFAAFVRLKCLPCARAYEPAYWQCPGLLCGSGDPTKCTIMQPAEGLQLKTAATTAGGKHICFDTWLGLLLPLWLSLSSLCQGLATEIIILVNPPKSFGGTSSLPQPPILALPMNFSFSHFKCSARNSQVARTGSRERIKEQSPGTQGWRYPWVPASN